MLDLAAEGRFGKNDTPQGEKDVLTLQAMKTGAILKFCCTAGAILGNAPQAKRDAVSRYGQVIGQAFQIADDLLDVEGDTATLGKAAGKDAAHGKAGSPGVLSFVQFMCYEVDLLVRRLRPSGAEQHAADLLRRDVAGIHAGVGVTQKRRQNGGPPRPSITTSSELSAPLPWPNMPPGATIRWRTVPVVPGHEPGEGGRSRSARAANSRSRARGSRPGRRWTSARRRGRRSRSRGCWGCRSGPRSCSYRATSGAGLSTFLRSASSEGVATVPPRSPHIHTSPRLPQSDTSPPSVHHNNPSRPPSTPIRLPARSHQSKSSYSSSATTSQFISTAIGHGHVSTYTSPNHLLDDTYTHGLHQHQSPQHQPAINVQRLEPPIPQPSPSAPASAAPRASPEAIRRT